MTDRQKEELAKELSKKLNNGTFNNSHYINDISSVLNQISFQYTQKDKRIEELQAKIKELKNETYKDQQLKDMKETLDRMEGDYYRGFPISKEQKENIQNWMNRHEAEKHKNFTHYHGCSGGGYSYIFYPSAIGTIGEIVCSTCRVKAFQAAVGDITKYQELLQGYDGFYEFRNDLG